MLKTITKFATSTLLVASLMAAASPSAAPLTPASPADPNRIVLTKDNTVSMAAQFSDESVARIALKARELDSRLPSGEPLYLVLMTPGGSIDAGLELIENLKTLNRPVHTITLFSASMGFQTVQGLGERYITSTGTLMSHKAKGGLQGEFPGQFDSRYAYYLKRVLKLDERTVERSKGKLTKESYFAKYRDEMWCDGQECVDLGVADRVVSVSCDKSLDGTTKDSTSVSFLGMSIDVSVVKAACPTITGVLSAEIGSKGKKLNLEDRASLRYDFPQLYDATPAQLQELQALINKKVKENSASREVIKSY